MKPVSMTDLNDISHGRELKDELTAEDKQRINEYLKEKKELIATREHNRAELAKVKRMDVAVEDRNRKYHSVQAGLDVINKNTRRISALSIKNIAKMLKLPLSKVDYYIRKTTYVSAKASQNRVYKACLRKSRED